MTLCSCKLPTSLGKAGHYIQAIRSMMHISLRSIWSFTFLLPLVDGLSWPYGPFNTSGNSILNAAGDNVGYAGVNWPGASEAMVPEGLQYSSIESIVSKIKSLGMNAIRLTYAIQMIDDIFDGEGDVDLKTAFTNALGDENGVAVYNKVTENNPQFGPDTTRLEVFDAIAAECFKQEIYVHLDNHVSKAQWCCSTDDGNSWFGDRYFDVAKWKRGLKYMATHAQNWGNLMSMGLRNELRPPDDGSGVEYGWSEWYTHMVAAANTVNQANSDVLIFFSGLSYGLDLSLIPGASPLGDGKSFHTTDFSYSDKIVLELHNYEEVSSCSDYQQGLLNGGFSTLDQSNSSVVNVLPMLMTEWGFSQDSSSYSGMYATCLADFLPSYRAGWTIWVLAGSYYIRSGTQDYDESWGLLDHTWADWRYSDGINSMLVPMINATIG